MAVVNVKYDTKTNLTHTFLDTTLANNEIGCTAAVDNSATDKYFVDVLVGGKIQAATSSDGTYDFYAVGSLDGGTTFSGGASGTDSEQSGVTVGHMMFLGAVVVSGNNTYEFGPWSVASAFGGVMPDQWAIVVDNNTGQAATAAANHEIHYLGIEYESA